MDYKNHWKDKLQNISERLYQVPGMEHEIKLQWGETATKEEIFSGGLSWDIDGLALFVENVDML